MTREPIPTQPLLLRGEAQRALAHTRIDKLPLDPDHPIEILIREQVKKRKMSLNDMMWAGPLKDFERDAVHDGRRFEAKVWHEHLKELFLPDESDFDFDPLHVTDGYRKWITGPRRGAQMLVGSTTQLTDKGMRHYLLQIEAEAATEYGVTFTTPEPTGRTRG